MRDVVAAEPFNCLCPCCGSGTVLLAANLLAANRSASWLVAGAEYDHWYGPMLNGPEHGRPICRACHAGVTRSDHRRYELSGKFHVFQDAVLERLRRDRAGRAARGVAGPLQEGLALAA